MRCIDLFLIRTSNLPLQISRASSHKMLRRPSSVSVDPSVTAQSPRVDVGPSASPEKNHPDPTATPMISGADNAGDGTGGSRPTTVAAAIAHAVFIRPARSIGRFLQRYFVTPVLGPIALYTVAPLKRGIITPLGDQLRPVQSAMWLFVTSALFYTIYCVFISIVLLRDTVHWDASTTNYIFTVLSQISALLTNAMLKSLLTAVRPALAAREGGSAFSTWMAQGSSGWMTAAQLAVSDYFLNVWSNFR